MGDGGLCLIQRPRCIGPLGKYAMLTKRLVAVQARDRLEGLKLIAWSRPRPLVRSDVELRPRTTPGSLGPKGRAAGGSSRAGVGPQLPRPGVGRLNA
jgi:hypothetical protein